MARLGTLRVDDVLDYSRDIKGKRLIRLKAGVGAGKNYWARHLLEKNPDLQILLITSRKNTAEGEAYSLGTDCKIHYSKLIDTEDRDWYADLTGKMIVCTNAYIDYFFKNIYKKEDTSTHLWNKFDLIFVDEVHSLTADASFADSPFAVERFIHHALQKNQNCDIVAMSGTPEASDWLFADEHWGTEYTNVDLYDSCIHLVPNTVILFAQSIIADRIYKLWKNQKRVIYFVNSVLRMAEVVKELQILGIPESDIGIAFSESDNAEKLPQSLVAGKEAIRNHLIEHKRILPSVKIFITTTQNKEGISIEDDDIEYMLSESHNKAELEQMAGRVRGNKDNGKGLHTLGVVYDAAPHPTDLNYIEKECDKKLLDYIDGIVDEHKRLIESSGKAYKRKNDIELVQKNHRFLRYDYIGDTFCFYIGREKCIQQNDADYARFSYLLGERDYELYCEIDKSGIEHIITGGYELSREWFPYSILYYSAAVGTPFSEAATAELVAFLRTANYLNVPLNTEKQDEVLRKIHSLIQKYGARELGFKSRLPAALKPALRRFSLTLEPTSSHHNNDKIMHLLPPIQE